MSPARRIPRLVWPALGVIYLVWGSTYAGIRVGVESIPPFWMASLRFTLAGLILFGFVAARGGLRQLPDRRQWLVAVVTGAALIGFGNGGVTWGELTVPSGVAAIIVSTTPLWMALMSRVFLGQRLGALVSVGLSIGFVGLIVLVGPTALRLDQLPGMAAVLLAAVGWAAGSVYSQRAPLPRDPFLTSAMQMLAGGLLMAPVAVATREPLNLGAITGRSWIAFVYLVLVGAVLGFSVYVYLLKSAPIALASTYAYVNPVVAVILGVFILGEQLTARTLIGGGVIILGVALIVVAQALRPKAQSVPERDLVPGAVRAPTPASSSSP